MANVIVPLTAKKIGASAANLSRAKVFYLPEDDIKSIQADLVNKGAVIKLKDRATKIEVYESVMDVKTGQAEGASTNPYIASNYTAVTAAGSVITSATDLTRYLNRVTAATADSADGVQLPPPSDRNVVVVVNGTSVPVEVFPNGASSYIDSGASGASKTLGAFKRLHFYTEPTTGNGASAVWKTAIDERNPS